MWPLNETELLTLLNAIFGAALVFVSTLYWVGRKASHAKAAAATKAAEAVALRVISLEGKLALVDQAVVPISAAFQAILIKELTHYHTPEMDELLTKVGPPSTLTASEIDDLARLLQARTIDMGPLISEAERGAAYILPIVMKRASDEYKLLEAAGKLRSTLVTVAVAHLMDL